MVIKPIKLKFRFPTLHTDNNKRIQGGEAVPDPAWRESFTVNLKSFSGECGKVFVP